MSKVGVVLWGMGKMGSALAKLVSEKSSLQLKGAIDINPKLVGKDIGEILGTTKIGIPISSDSSEVLSQCVPQDVVVITTGSHVPQVLPIIRKATSHQLNVLSSAEEMAFPSVKHPKLAAEINEMARKASVRVMGTGVNPGFIFDLLAITLTGACHHVRGVKAYRAIDLSVYGKVVIEAMGLGLEPEEFERKVEKKEVVGHVGFEESVELIAKALGFIIEKKEETLKPIIATVPRSTDVVDIKAGQVAGCNHSFRAYSEGKLIIELVHPISVMPHLEGYDVLDELEIDGEPPIHLRIKPAVEGKLATTAMLVNMIPLLHHAPTGLISMLDVPIPRCIS